MKEKLLLIIILFAFSIAGFSQTDKQSALPQGCIQLTPADIHWTDTSSVLAKGTRYSVLYGDIKKEGPFAIRLQLPPNLIIKTHHHLNDEVVTVLNGSVSVGFGDNISSSATKTFTTNSFYVNAAKVEHFVVVGKEGVTIQINAMGPWVTTFE